MLLESRLYSRFETVHVHVHVHVYKNDRMGKGELMGIEHMIFH